MQKKLNYQMDAAISLRALTFTAAGYNEFNNPKLDVDTIDFRTSCSMTENPEYDRWNIPDHVNIIINCSSKVRFGNWRKEITKSEWKKISHEIRYYYWDQGRNRIEDPSQGIAYSDYDNCPN